MLSRVIMILAILFYLGITNTVGTIRRAALSLTFLDVLISLEKRVLYKFKGNLSNFKVKILRMFSLPEKRL